MAPQTAEALMSNKEGYTDRTADMAIAHVSKEEKAMRKGGHKTNGSKRCTKTEESQKIRQHPTR